ncbi:hypothetical protein BJY01DRAFT_248153 [Aspergillus pseudoustus]|uniref:PBP domain-containing protein n=1 Tax=Aspergillus pseudoustus TaxID=1810923 RepID=A0ABR4JWW4_9EURO
MSLSQLAVVADEAYQLLTDGTIKQYTPSNKPTWKTIITSNPDNVQIAGNSPLGIRQSNGTVYRVAKTVQAIGTNASRLWGHNGAFWQWQKGNSKLWYMGRETGGRWEVRDTNPHTTDLAFVGDVTYQIAVNGQITRYESPGHWAVTDSSYSNTAIAADSDALYALKRDGTVARFDEAGKWELIGGAPAVQIAGGAAGLFQRQADGKIYKYTGGPGWSLVDDNGDNVDIAVANSAYRVTATGEIYILRAQNGSWERIKEKDAHPAPPTDSGVQPEAVYDGGFKGASQVLLRIGNGGAGQTGLVKVLAEAYIKSRVAGGAAPFKVAWYKSDTTESIKYLKDGVTDVGITYTQAAEDLAIEQGIALSSHYIFREHFLLTGPPSNPAKLDPNADIFHQLSKLYETAEAGNTTPAVRFLSRYDKSATSIKDSELWIKIGQVPWAMKYSNWYHQYMAYPIQALTAAAVLQEYTLTDWGTYLSVDDSVQKQVTVYKHGQDDPKDVLLMPAHLLVGAKAQDLTLAKDFATWATGTEGQATIASFKKRDQQVYSTAP